MPHRVVLAFTDPYEHERAIRGDTDIVVTKPGDYRAELKRLDFNRLWMQRRWQNLPWVSHSSLIEGRVVFEFPAHYGEPPMGIQGTELYPGDISMAPVGGDYHCRILAGSRWASMSLPPGDLAESGRVLVGCDIVAPNATKFLRPPPHLMSILANLHQAACELATTAPDIFAHPEVSKAIEQALIPALIACLSDGASCPLPGCTADEPPSCVVF